MRTLLSDYIIDGRYSHPVKIYPANCLINEIINVPNPNDASGSKNYFIKH